MRVCADIFGRLGSALRGMELRGSAGRVMIGNALRGVAWLCMAGNEMHGNDRLGMARHGRLGTARHGAAKRGDAGKDCMAWLGLVRRGAAWQVWQGDVMQFGVRSGTARYGYAGVAGRGTVQRCHARCGVAGRPGHCTARWSFVRLRRQDMARRSYARRGSAGTATGTDPWRLGETSGFSTDKEAVCQKQ